MGLKFLQQSSLLLHRLRAIDLSYKFIFVSETYNQKRTRRQQYKK
jgi:hypothetical protein